MAKLPYVSSAEAYPSARFDPLPKGQYQAVVVSSELCQTKAGNGYFVKLMWQIIEPGQYCNRTLFSQHNVANPNSDAEQIGRRELQDFATAMNVDQFDETDQLHGKPIVLRIGIEQDKSGQYAEKNKIVGVADVRPTQAVLTSNTSKPNAFASTGKMSAGNMPNGAPPAHVAAAASGSATAKRAAMGNTRSNPFAE